MTTGSGPDSKQDLLRSALDTLSADVVILDAVGTIVAANGTWNELAEESGLEAALDFSGPEFLEVIEGVDDRYAAQVADGLTSLLDGERGQFELEYPYRSTGERRWMLLRASSFTHQGEHCVVVAHTEITDRKRREKALRDAYEISTGGSSTLEEQIEELLELARDVIGTEHATFSRVEEGHFTFEVVTSKSGTNIEAGDTVPIGELPNRERVVETRGTTVHRGTEVDTNELGDSGESIGSYLGAPVTVDGEVYGTFCFYSMEGRTVTFSEWEVTFVDLLSKWVSYELERQEREEKLQQLKENVTDVIWMSSPEKDEMEFISDSYEDVWGRAPDSLDEDPTSFVDGIHPDDREHVEQALSEQQVHPDEYEETYRVVHPDGTVRWVHDRSAGVYADEELERTVGIATDITDRKERERELAYQTALLEAQAETSIDGLLLVDSDRSIRYHNDRFLDLWGIPEDVTTERSDEALLELVSDRLANPDTFQERVEYLYKHPKEQSRDTVELADGRWLDRYTSPVIGDDGTHYGRLWVFRDITERKAREQTLEDQRDELVQLQRVNTLVRQNIQALQNTDTRDGIETAVCDALTESELYQAAWVGDWTETKAGARTVRPKTVAGVDESYLDGIPTEESSPAERALHTGDVVIIDDIETAPEFPDERRKTALAEGHRMLAAVPLTKADTTYGVLVVYAPPNHTINEIEQDILGDFGQSIALAIQRVHSQQSLTAETAVSLYLQIPDTRFVFGTVSADLGAELSLDRRVATADGASLYYLRVDDGEATEVCEHLTADPLITACRVVREEDTAQPTLLEARLAEEPQVPLDVLTDYGATVTSARAVDGDIMIRAELPSRVEVRTVLTAVREVAPATRLVSKQHVERPTKTAPAMQNLVMAQLTDKQEAALKAAYTRGYYNWPRESTMEELAESFDISAPTLHYRIRNAHDTVISSLLDPPEIREDR